MMMIDIDHVSFQYSGAEQENLQDFNLQIKKGECVVLTGESGCGKTCVTRLINTLIPHFYEGEMSGAVLIDARFVRQDRLCFPKSAQSILQPGYGQRDCVWYGK